MPAPLPSVAPTTPHPGPTGDGATFAYSGTLTQTFTRFGTPAPYPSPGATPQPTATPWVSTSTTTVTQKVAVTGGASFGGQTGLTDFATQETDAGQHETTTASSDAYITSVPDAKRVDGVDVTLVGWKSKTSNGISSQLQNGSGNGVFDELPVVTNAHWSESAVRTQSEVDVDSQTETTTYAADGTYAGSWTYPTGDTAQIAVYPDGSGVYQLPIENSIANSTVTVSAPANGQISLQVSLTHGIPVTQIFSVPLWYPSMPPLLAEDVFTDEGTVPLPSVCAAASAYAATPVRAVVERKQRLDPVFGELETSTQTSYLSDSYGLICATTHDDLETYYDYSGQTAYIIAFGSKPIQSTIVDETLALQNTNALASDRRRTNSASRATLVQSAAVLSARTSSIIAQRRAAHVRELFSALRTRKATR